MKDSASAGVSKVDVLEFDTAAEMDQLAGVRLVDDAMVLADDLDGFGNAGNELGGVDEREGKIARTVQDSERDRDSQNHVTGADLPLAPQIQGPGEHAARHQPETEIVQRTRALDIHQAVTVRRPLDFEQPLETPTL